MDTYIKLMLHLHGGGEEKIYIYIHMAVVAEMCWEMWSPGLYEGGPKNNRKTVDSQFVQEKQIPCAQFQ